MDLVAQTGDYTFVVALLFWVIVFGFLSGAVYQSRGGSFGAGFLLGALLGIIGLLIVAVIKPSPPVRQSQDWTRKCLHCLQDIPAGAAVCFHCGRESEAWVWKDDRWWAREEGAWHWFDAPTGQWVKWQESRTEGSPG